MPTCFDFIGTPLDSCDTNVARPGPCSKRELPHEKHEQQDFFGCVGSSFAMHINIANLWPKGDEEGCVYICSCTPWVFSGPRACRPRAAQEPRFGLTDIIYTTTYQLTNMSESDRRLNNVHPYVAENPMCRNDFMV
jgi:hypothetical protein